MEQLEYYESLRQLLLSNGLNPEGYSLGMGDGVGDRAASWFYYSLTGMSLVEAVYTEYPELRGRLG